MRPILPGSPFPLGATWDGSGVNVALTSACASGVDLCLFADPGAQSERERIPLVERTGPIWHGYVPGIGPGQCYGFRVHGQYHPGSGLRGNPHKLLVDPYARAIDGRLDWHAPVFGYRRDHPGLDLSFDEEDDAWGKPKSVVIDSAFDWGADCPPGVPWPDTVIYEVHLKGFTKQHPDIPEQLRGTYKGLEHPAALDHLTRLGVTAVELLPIQAILDEEYLVRRGMSNYWGYNTLGYFAPEPRYANATDAGEQVAEFKGMVQALHAAGIEVILDVVYNHTGEGNELGPTVSLRGINNRAYYHLQPGAERYYMDYTGTGNSLHGSEPETLKLITDSLRYWVEVMHVDGFRFDLATVLARHLHDVDRFSPFLDVVHQDPVLSRVKLIAEPWDIGEGGYQIGNFPWPWSEWNGRYRDTVRRYWRGDPGCIPDLAQRLLGSPDLYTDDRRHPHASVNFVTAHDGFTLADVVTYDHKHNEANGEGNRDGTDANWSCNYGHDGPSDAPEITARRQRQQRNLLATLLLSQGVPMLCGGDEIGRTQIGNNNAYCQDNALSWFDWDLDERRRSLLEFTRFVIALRRTHPCFRLHRFPGESEPDGGSVAAEWLRPDGQVMTDTDWSTAWARAIALRLTKVGRDGQPVADHALLLNAAHNAVHYTLPGSAAAGWQTLLDTASWPSVDDTVLAGGEGRILEPQSLVLLHATVHRVTTTTRNPGSPGTPAYSMTAK